MPDRYVPNTSIVSAMQFTGDNLLDVVTFANSGKDPAQNDTVTFNGTTLFVVKPGKPEVAAHAGDWIVSAPDGTLDVQTSAAFGSQFTKL